jgi:GDP-L-fucose synthase
VFLLRNYEEPGPINVGTGLDLSIGQLAELIAEIVHPAAELVFDASKPDGMPRKVLDVSRINAMGWTATTSLRDGIASTYEWFLAQN